MFGLVFDSSNDGESSVGGGPSSTRVEVSLITTGRGEMFERKRARQCATVFRKLRFDRHGRINRFKIAAQSEIILRTCLTERQDVKKTREEKR